MAISFACPACDRGLKVKDELAGRKVKCPKCGEGVFVPAEDEDEEEKGTAAPAKASRPRDDEDDAERPRKKKKKKKQKDNKTLLILSAVGGVLLVGVVIVVVIVSSGKEKPAAKGEPPPPQAQQVVQAPPLEKEEPQGRVSRGARAAADTQIIQNDLKQLALFWNTYRTERGKPPRDWPTFKAYLRTAQNLVQAVDEGKYKLVLNAQPASNVVFAYEWPADDSRRHIVAFGDGSVDTIFHDELLSKVPGAGK